MALFIAYPWLAAFVSAGCGGLWFYRRRRAAAVAASSWLVYAAYEQLMKARVLCSGECNIRVDLLVIYPFLIAVSIAALVKTARPPVAVTPPARPRG